MTQPIYNFLINKTITWSTTFLMFLLNNPSPPQFHYPKILIPIINLPQIHEKKKTGLWRNGLVVRYLVVSLPYNQWTSRNVKTTTRDSSCGKKKTITHGSLSENCLQLIPVVHTDMDMQLHLIPKMFPYEQMLNRLYFLGSCNSLVCDGTMRDKGTMIGQLVKFFI